MRSGAPVQVEAFAEKSLADCDSLAGSRAEGPMIDRQVRSKARQACKAIMKEEGVKGHSRQSRT